MALIAVQRHDLPTLLALARVEAALVGRALDIHVATVADGTSAAEPEQTPRRGDDR